jgi:hypothetical protein
MTTSACARSLIHRVAIFSLKASAAAVAAGALYVAVPAVLSAPRMAAMLDDPKLVRALSDAMPGDAYGARGAGTYPAALILQAAQTLRVSPLSGVSVQTEVGGDWRIPDSSVAAAVTPGAGHSVTMEAWCWGRKPVYSVEVLRARRPYTAAEADSQRYRLDIMNEPFQLLAPWVIEDHLKVTEAHGTVSAVRKHYAPAWQFPSLGTIAATQDRRADIMKSYPDMGRLDCSPKEPGLLSAGQSQRNIPGAEVLDGWQASDPRLPKAVRLGPAKLPPGEVEVFRNQEGYPVLSIAWTVTGAYYVPPSALDPVFLALSALVEKHGALDSVEKNTEDRTWTWHSRQRHYRLQNGEVQVEALYGYDRTTYRMVWDQRGAEPAAALPAPPPRP